MRASEGTELLVRVATGDEAAFGELVRAWEARFFRVARRLLGDADAEDGVQIAFLRVHRKAADYRGEAPASTWLYRVLTNVCIDVARRRGRRPLLDGAADVEEATGPERSETLRLDLRRALARLPPEMRAVVVLRFSEDLSYDDIARVRGVSVNTVKTHLARAKRALRDHLKGESS